MGFSVTFEKVQGQTLPKVVLDFNERRNFVPKVYFEGLLVGLSRVRHGNDFRVLPLLPAQSFNHLLKLKPARSLVHWLSGFDDTTGVWHQERSLASLESDQRRG